MDLDNQFRAMKDSTGTGGTIISLICSCACLAGVITYMVYLGIYAFNNPDPEACWWTEGDVHGSATEPIVTGDAVAVNVHVTFVNWFVWGFWTCVAPCLSIPLFCIVGCLGMPQVLTALGGLLSCGVGCSSLFWIIFGTVWRFGSMGKACSRDALTPIDAANNQSAEDYATQVSQESAAWGLQAKSGSFMKVWLIINFVIIGLKVLGCIAAMLFKR